jgi:dienelactone hydrolase
MHQVKTEEIRFQAAEEIQARISRPADAGHYPAIVMLHGRNGPTDPFWQIGEHYAKEGIVSLAVNYMTNRDPENPEVMPTIEAAFNYIKSQPDVDPREIALSGYCRGGGLTYMGLARFAGFTSGVLFHGAVNEDSPKINVPIIILHGVSDPAVSIDKVFGLAKELNAQGKTFQLKTYSGCEHVFTMPGAQYQPEAAEDAFKEAVQFLRRTYGQPAGEVGPLFKEPVPA